MYGCFQNLTYAHFNTEHVGNKMCIVVLWILYVRACAQEKGRVALFVCFANSAIKSAHETHPNVCEVNMGYVLCFVVRNRYAFVFKNFIWLLIICNTYFVYLIQLLKYTCAVTAKQSFIQLPAQVAILQYHIYSC